MYLRLFIRPLLPLLIVGLLGVQPILPQDKLNPTNLSKLNTKADEDDPFPTPDGLGLLYTSNAEGTLDLMLSQRKTSTSPWGAGKPLKDVNTKSADERSPFMTRDSRLYYANNRIPDPTLKDLKNFDILERIRPRAPEPLLHVSTKDDELFPWIVAQSKEFYFSRKTEEGWRVFVSPIAANGSIGKGQLVKDLPAGFYHATLTANGLTMYLQGPGSGKRSALFRSTRSKIGGSWSKPQELEGLAHAEGKHGDLSPALNATGTVLYFVSDRPGGQGGLDIWSIPINALTKIK